MTKETPQKTKVPAWITAALEKKRKQSHDSFDNSSKDLGQKTSKQKPTSGSSGSVIPHRPQK